MRPIHDTHVEQPGPAAVEVAAADDATAFTVQDLLAANYTITPGDHTVRDPASPTSDCVSSWACGKNRRGTGGQSP
ncbi:DUF6207 family protein [Streptomyces canus]|uniref:DUF6207 family protein n=1 Tax=Streptomyces canus TaxID=58343 RepID=UPI00224CDE94|nr:DUF6207 family protein [Streptomyces canus]MCX5254984.1 DUF6207 family protein [Streptomyces canus]